MGVLSGIVLLMFIIATKGWGDLISQMKNLRTGWLIGGFLCMLLYWIFESQTLYTITKAVSGKHVFKDAFNVTMVGQFFNSITPFASGGQPAQLYSLSKKGIKAGTAGSILMIKFIIYQSVLTIYSLMLILWKAPFFQDKLNNLFYLTALGFTINAAVIIFLIIFSKYRNLTCKLFRLSSKILIKFNIVKDIKKIKESIDNNLQQFHENILIIKNNKTLVVKSIIYTIIQLTVFYLIPYCIYYSFGMNGAEMADMIAANSFVMMLTAFVPLPGAVGGAEGGFYIFFKLFFNKNNIMTGILLWRLLTFYSCIIFGAYAAVKIVNTKKMHVNF